MKILFLLFIPILSFESFAQTSGTAGVRSTSELVFWLRADKGTVRDGSNNVDIWTDQANSNDASNASPSTNPSFDNTTGIGANLQPGILFDSTALEFLDITDDNSINSTSFTTRTIFIVFRTSTDVSTLQYLYHQGDATDGLSIYIQSGNLNMEVIGSSSSTIVTSATTLTTDSTYIATFIYDGGTPNLELILNNSSEDTDGSVASSVASHTIIKVGSSTTPGNYFDGHISEIAYYNVVLNSAEISSVNNHLSEKYGITITNDYYSGAGSTYRYDVASIERVGAEEHNVTKGYGGTLYLSENVNSANDELASGDHIFTGHNNANLSTTSSDLTGLSGVERFNRIWYLQKTTSGTVGINLKFDVGEAGYDTPTDPNDYKLIYRAGTSGNFVEETTTTSISGDTVIFRVDEGDLSSGYYSLGLPSTSKIWYVLNSGAWNSSSTWTLDPAGVLNNNNDNLTPSTSPTASTDEVYIASGKSVTVTTDGDISTTLTKLTVYGTLDFGGTSGHSTITTLIGSGTIKFSGDDATSPYSVNLPTFTDASHFVTTNQGEGTFEVYGSEDVELTTGDINTFYNLKVNLTNAAEDEFIITTDITINGDLEISSGNLQINDATDDVTHDITVGGDLTVTSSGKISVGTGDPTLSGGEPADNAFYTSFHKLLLSGNFTNNGTVRFTNQTKPHFTDHTNTGAVTVEFTGSSNNTATLNGTTDFYQLHINKGSDQTYILTINSADSLYFGIYGKCNGVVSGLTSTPNPTYAARNLWIQNGTLKLTGELLIPTLTEDLGSGNNNNNAFIPANGGLWIAGANVDVRQSSTDQTRFDGVTLQANRTAYVVFGTFRISDGQFLTEKSESLEYDDTNSGKIIIEGGYLELSQIKPLTNGGGGTPSYFQSGGTLKMIGTTIGTGNLDASGGRVTGTDMAVFEFGETNSSFTMSGGEIILIDAEQNQGGVNGLDIGSKKGNYNVTGGTITIDVATNQTDATDPFEISSTANIYNLTITETDGDWVDMKSDLTITNDLLVETTTTLDMNAFNLTVGRNFSVSSGATYTQGGNNITYFNGSSEQAITLDGTITTSFYDVTVQSTGVKTLQSGNMTISNLLTIKSGAALNDGGNTFILNGNISNAGTHTSDAGGEIQFTGGSAIHTISNSGTFGNLTLNDATYDVAISANISITDTLTFSQDQLLDLDIYSLTMSGGNAYISGASTARYILLDGNASDGGLIMFVDDEDDNGTETTTFPVGADGLGTARYTPLVASFSSITDSGYVQLSIGDKILPTVASTANMLTYYWRIRHSGFGSVPKVTSYVFTGSTSDEVGCCGSWRAGKVLDTSPFTRSVQANGSYSGAVMTFTDGGTPFNLELASYTGGKNSNFVGQPDVYYSKNDGNFNTGSIWSRNAADGSGAAGPPVAGNVVVIQYGVNDTGASHRINVQAAIPALGAIIFDNDDATYPNPSSEEVPRLQFFIPGSFDIGNVSGTGMVSFDAGDNPTVIADFGDFAADTNSYFLYFNGPATLTAIPTPIPNLMMESATYDINQSISTNFNLIVQGDGTIEPQQNITIGGDLIIGTWIGGTFQFPSQAGAITVSINGDIDFTIDPFASPSTRTLIVDNANTQNVEHTLIVKGDILHGSDNGQTIDLWESDVLERVILEFQGSTNNSYSRTSTSEPELYRVVLNKGADQTYSFTFDESFTINGATNGTTKALELQNGKLILNDAGINIYLSTGSNDFEIPAEAALQVSRGTVNVSGTDTGIYLDGLLRVDTSGVVDMDGGSNNYIEYSASGNATIEIDSSGQLIVGTQVRKNSANNEGILNFSQGGSSTFIVGNNPSGGTPATNRSMFEVSGTGSSFSFTGGTMIVANDVSTAGIASLYLDPDGSPTISAGTLFQFGNVNTGAGTNALTIQSQPSLSNILIDNSAGANYPTLTMQNISLSVTEDLEIETNTSFDANSFSLTIGGDLINPDGATGFTSNSNTTTFNGSNLQQITGDGTSFFDLTYSGSDTLQLGSTTSIDISNELRIESGVFDDNNNDVFLSGTVYNITTYTNSNASSTNRGLVFDGSGSFQNINGSGNYSRMHIENIYGVTVNADITVTELVALDGGPLDILGNELNMDSTAVFADSTGSGFSSSNMVQTRRSFTDAGIIKTFNGIGASPFIFPIGSGEKYTPFTVTLSGNSATDATISIRAADEPHPSVQEDVDIPEFVDTDNVLQYYWEVLSSNFTDFTGSLEFKFKGSDAYVTAPYTIDDYAVAKVLPNSGDPPQWNKGTDFGVFNKTNHTITFSLTNPANDNSILGEYTAGIIDAIPDEVQTISSTLSGGSGNWTNTANWNPATIPKGVIVDIAAGDTIIMDAGSQTVYKTIIDGVLDVGATTNNRLGTVSGTGTLKIESGSLPAGVYYAFFDCSTGGTIEFSGGTDYTLPTLIGNARNINISGGNAKSLPNLNTTICGDLEILEGSTLNNPQNVDLTVEGDLSVTNGTLDIGSGAMLIVEGNGLLTSGTLSISNNSVFINGNLTLNGGTLNLGSGTLDIDGNLIIAGTTLNGANSSNLKVGGNITYSSGSFAVDATTTTVTLDGTGNQTISGIFTGSSSFKNLTINKASGGVSLVDGGNDIEIDGILTLTSGIVTTDASNSLILTSTATISGGSSTSFVSGPLIKQGLAAAGSFTFQIGKGSEYAIAGIQSIGTGSQTWTAEFFGTNANSPQTIDITTNTEYGTMTEISSLGSWVIASSGSNTAKVKLGVQSHLAVSSMTDVRVANYNKVTANKWVNLGGSSTGTTSNGSITAQAALSFSSDTFSLGGVNDAALPVELLYFSGEMFDQDVKLNWATTLELNNDFFQILRSKDGSEFEVIGKVPGMGNSSEIIEYQFIDPSPYFGISFYQLKQVDYDGKSEVFKPILINNTSKLDGIKVSIFPNPSPSDLIQFEFKSGDENSPVFINIFDASGRMHYNSIISPDIFSKNYEIVPSDRIKPGMYFLKVVQGKNQKVSRLIIRDQ